MPEIYTHLAAEYDVLLGELAEQTWQQGILAELLPAYADVSVCVVDLGAGTGVGGRLLAELGTGAYRIGVDRSAAMLDRAGGCYEKTFVADIATALPLTGLDADVVVSGFDTFNYLTAGQLTACLRYVGGCLRPGGCVFFDYSTPYLLRHEWCDAAYDQAVAGDGHLHWRHRFDSSAARSVTEVSRHAADGTLRWRETHAQYALDTCELGQIAAAAGLSVSKVRDLSRGEFSPVSRTHLWALRKDW